ncbi:hypothetical protein GCM10011519_06720 [Marmoricola endophyticus]|uniref:PH domain-containing protein n=1 Tax=Marmoricola endophyticus TaxID=2040280 RepID=A0A917F1M5_9ACTN|nr:hypothetical protein [Marmoricola endophyticus]GGF35853.1 hypothetical protein GCM10011519_06720 [Marmoricola endophyticus]
MRGLRGRRAPALAPLEPAPKVADLPHPLLQGAGRYLGTVAGDRRLRDHGLGRAGSARIQLSEDGVDVVRLGAAFRIPAAGLTSARDAESFPAGGVGPQGALVLRWRHDGQVLDTGFCLQRPAARRGSPATADEGRADMQRTHREWSRAVAKIRKEH